MTTMFRKVLGAASRLGVQVLDLGPGAAVISRRGGYTATKLSSDAWLVAGKLSRSSRAPRDGWGLHKAAASSLCTRHVADFLVNYEVNCVFDVGANKGQYGKQLRESGYRGRIVSFEPVPDALAKLRKAAERDRDWLVYPCALGRGESVETMHLGWKTMNSLLEPSAYGQQRYKRFADTSTTTQVQVRRLDEVMDEALEGIADPRPYLKMDTQGFDMEVFAGAGKRIDEYVGMQSEVAALRLYEGSPHMTEAITAYQDAGFEITGMYPVTREAATGRVVEFDCVMARAAFAPADGPGK
ncbi:FkbM family methyltransferase [Streptomyces abyssalis]|uniref:FkbM family methyltransferase n=1 Tax=Streptomyces abyssalis TaxID=933944 RepID=A0A1E7JP35_9ACTN|nr:FkbM family methyltransferase [Streptomyces abyssalis]OEU86572.1 FkbM family methyltransferase [Streptomyces abyssalis]OEU90039.1 FkbM family methyltransferase [Streptomyces abyssalis]OEV30474.1 FkbM family methyltransferase [Streptomyces nanshensis]